PPGLRDRLSEALSVDAPHFAREVAATSDRLFAASEPPGASSAHLAWRLEGAYRASRRGDRATAEEVLNQLARTPLAPRARALLTVLGLPNRARRALVAMAVVGAVLVLGAVSLGLTRKDLDRADTTTIREQDKPATAAGGKSVGDAP